MSNASGKTRRIKAATEGDIATVTIVDSALLGSELVRQLGEELYGLIDISGHKKIIVDCSNVDYISSAALNKLIVLQKKLFAAGGQLVLCGLTPAVSDVFTVTRLNQKFNIHSNRAAARESI